MATTTRVRVEIDRLGLAAFLKSPTVTATLRGRAEAVAARARATAPVDTGAYRASIHVEPDTTDRAVLRVIADVPYGRFVEAKTGNMARALGDVGG